MYRFYIRRAKQPKYNTVDAVVENATPRCLLQDSKKRKNTQDFSPTLHLSTEARPALKSPTSLHIH
jgi:Tfp pilus assembly protein PilF